MLVTPQSHHPDVPGLYHYIRELYETRHLHSQWAWTRIQGRMRTMHVTTLQTSCSIVVRVCVGDSTLTRGNCILRLVCELLEPRHSHPPIWPWMRTV